MTSHQVIHNLDEVTANWVRYLNRTDLNNCFVNNIPDCDILLRFHVHCRFTCTVGSIWCMQSIIIFITNLTYDMQDARCQNIRENSLTCDFSTKQLRKDHVVSQIRNNTDIWKSIDNFLKFSLERTRINSSWHWHHFMNGLQF